jgi:opacity protein-like surface antigen
MIETVRARIGYAFGPTGSFLVYITGGATFANQSYSSGLLLSPFTTINEWKRTEGWTVGGGAEYGITPWLSLKGEILYVNLNRKDYPGEVACGGDPKTATCVFDPVSIKSDFVLARMGLNWRFWWGKGKGPAPVVASY